MKSRKIWAASLAAVLAATSTSIVAFATPAAGDTQSGTYAITKGTEGSGGSFTIDKTEAAEGDTVTITATHGQNFAPKIDVRSADNKPVRIDPAQGNPPPSFPAEGDQVQQVTSTFTFTMPAQAVTVTGEFAQLYTITNATANDANGTITINNFAPSNERLEITVTPASGYELDTLTATGTRPGNVNDQEWTAADVINGKITYIMPNDNMTFTATFKQAKAYHINSSALLNGSTTESPWKMLTVVPTADADDEVTFTISDPYRRLTSLKVNTGDAQTSIYLIDPDTDAPVDFVGNNTSRDFTFNMPAADVTIEAVGVLLNDIIVKSDITHGTVSLDKEFAEKDETVTITVTPDTGYELDTIDVKRGSAADAPSVDLTEVTAGTTYTFDLPGQGRYYVNATFKQISGEPTPSTPTPATPVTPVEPVTPTTSGSTTSGSTTSTTTSDTTSSAAATVDPVKAEVKADVKVGETVTVKSDDLGGDVTVATDKEDTALEGAKLELEATNDKTATTEKINTVVGSEASTEIKAVVEVAVKAVEEGNAVTLDISFKKDGNSVQPGMAVTITAPVPAALKDADKLFVYHVTVKGFELVDAKFDKEKGTIAITNNAFSPYIISKVELKAAGEATTSSTSSASTTSTNPAGNPNTGVALAVAPIVLAGAAVAIVSMKKRK